MGQLEQAVARGWRWRLVSNSVRQQVDYDFVRLVIHQFHAYQDDPSADFDDVDVVDDDVV